MALSVEHVTGMLRVLGLPLPRHRISWLWWCMSVISTGAGRQAEEQKFRISMRLSQIENQGMPRAALSLARMALL